MFKKIIDAISGLFSNLFGGGKKKPQSGTDTSLPNTEIPQDGSEIRPDTIVIVADEMEDISAWLAVLCEDAPVIESRARGDEATGGSADPRGLPRRRSASDTAAATEKARVLSRNANTAMPKGRNFH